MLVDTFADRLKKALDYNNMRAIDLSKKTKINKSLISSYLNGICKAKQDKLDIIAEILNVSEAWLMGYDVDMARDWIDENKEKNYIVDYTDDIKELVSIYKALLPNDKEFMLNMMKERKKQIDKGSEKNEQK